MTRKKKLITGLILLGLILVGVFSVKPIARRIPGWLTVRDAPQKADVIVVLGGDSSGRRVDKAVELYKAGYSKQMIMSGGSLYMELTWADLMTIQAISDGVSFADVRSQRKSCSTEEDARYTSGMIGNPKRIILVTSSWHSRRALRDFRLYLPNAEIISCPTEDNFGDWWQNVNGGRVVVSELLKTIW